MDDTLTTASFDKATVFESGYALGFRQVEVRNLRFQVVPITGGGEYDAGTFVERGKRKEQVVPLQRVLILDGWDHPVLETSTVHSSNGITFRNPKFTVFSPGWDGLLDEYLTSKGLLARVIIDGRHRSDLAPRSGPPRPIARPTPTDTHDIEGQDVLPGAFVEGATENVLLDRFERDPQARAMCLHHHGYRCQACRILMSDVYGPRGNEYIHVHHRVPLSEIRHEYRVDPISDLVPVCPNCHAMIHRSSPPMAVEELAQLVQGGGAAQPGIAAGGASPRR